MDDAIIDFHYNGSNDQMKDAKLRAFLDPKHDYRVKSSWTEFKENKLTSTLDYFPESNTVAKEICRAYTRSSNEAGWIETDGGFERRITILDDRFKATILRKGDLLISRSKTVDLVVLAGVFDKNPKTLRLPTY
jgi:hypothetical protein